MTLLSGNAARGADASGDGGGVCRLGPARQREAVGKLGLAGVRAAAEQAARFVRFADESGLCLDHLFGWIDRRGRLGQVALIIPQAGRTGITMVSRPGRRGRDELTEVVCRAADTIRPEQAVLLQAMLEPGDRHEAAALEGAGFEYLSELEYRRRGVPRSVDPPVMPVGVTREDWAAGDREAFVGALQASYERTLDCPGLRGRRGIGDVIRGHQAVGRFDPRLWTLLRIDGRPAGTMLLNGMDDQQMIELVYLGLAPWARGRGLGRWLLNLALWQASAASADAIVLAVDRSNAPAMQLYRSFGFRRFSRKRAWVRSL